MSIQPQGRTLTTFKFGTPKIPWFFVRKNGNACTFAMNWLLSSFFLVLKYRVQTIFQKLKNQLKMVSNSFKFTIKFDPLKNIFGSVYIIPDQVSFWYNFILVPHWVSMFVYMISTKISFRNKSFWNKFIPTVAPDRNFHSRLKSDQTFHKYNCKGGTSSIGYRIRHVD